MAGSSPRAPLRRNTEERFRLFVENVKDYAIFFIDREGTITSWNAGVARLLGYTEDQFVGRPFSLIFLPEDVAALAPQRELSTAAQIGRSDDERWHVRQDRTRFWASGVLTALRDRRGRLREFAKIMRDVTERKLAEEERTELLRREQLAVHDARMAAHARDLFLSTLSHELRTPLNAILTWTAVLGTTTQTQTSLHRGLETIARHARTQARMVDALLDAPRVLTGSIQLHVEPMELSAVVRAVIAEMAIDAGAKSIAIDTWLEDPEIHVVGDPARVKQIIEILLANAIAFTPEGGRVTVNLATDQEDAVLRVSDTGVGIDPGFLPYVFEPFRQGDGSTRRRHGGLGLGLALTRHVVERHGGSIAAASPGPGQGAVFTVRLPLASKGPSATVAADSHRSTSLHGLQVLVIDDDDDAREATAMALELAGAMAEAASSAAQGLRSVDQQRPDVIVCDIGMPFEDGFDFIRMLRALPGEHGGQTPAIALTAYADLEDRLRVLTSGFQMHLPKPVQLSDLIAGIAALTGRRP